MWGQSLPWHKVLNAVVAELSIYKWKSQRGCIYSLLLWVLHLSACRCETQSNRELMRPLWLLHLYKHVYIYIYIYIIIYISVFKNNAIWKFISNINSFTFLIKKAIDDACIIHIKGTIPFLVLCKGHKWLWQFWHQLYTMKSPIRTYLVTALHEYLAIFHILDLYSTN